MAKRQPRPRPEMERIELRVPADWLRRVEEMAEAEGQKRNAFVIDAVNRRMRELAGPGREG